MHDQSLHTGVARQIEQRAEVVEIRMTHERRVHHATVRADPRNCDASRSTSMRTRPRVEHHHRVTGLDEVHGSIPHSKHRAHKVWGRLRDFTRKQRGRDERDRTRQRKPPQPRARSEQHECDARKQTHRAHERHEFDLPRCSQQTEGSVDELKLEPCRKPERQTERRDHRRAYESEQRLWIRQRKRHGRQWRTQECEHETPWLDRAEMRECNRSAREKGCDSRG